MVAGVCVDTHDKWVGMSDDGHGGHGTFLRTDGSRPSTAGTSPGRSHVKEQHCDGSRPEGVDNLLIKLPRWAGMVPASPPRGWTSPPHDNRCQ